MIRKQLDKIRKNRFLVHVLTLMSGTAIAQGILFLFTPLLTRLFSPDDFGVFALYTALVSSLGIVAAWKYELAVMLPAKDEDARTLVWLSFFATIISSLLILILSLVLHDQLVSWFGAELGLVLYIVPAGVFFASIFQIMLNYSSRFKEFSRVSGSRIMQAGSGVGSQSLIGALKLFPLGLVWGKLFSDFSASLLLLWYHIRKGRLPGPLVSKLELKRLAREYDQFPRYQSLATFTNSLSQNLPAILLTFYYAPAIAGLYALTVRVLRAPTLLIGKSTREVYYQRASEMHSKGEPIFGLFRQTLGSLIKVGILPFIALTLISPWLFAVLFGEEWREAGQYAQLIIPWSFMGFINAPATMSLYVLGKQKFNMRYETSMFVARFLSLWLSWYFLDDPYLSIAIFAATGLLFNVYLISYAYRVVAKYSR